MNIKNHPFAVEAFFENSTVLTFAVPKEQLQGFIPECLELDNFQDKWSFIAVAMVKTKGLRPKGFPKFLGKDFFLIGYRIFVRFTNEKGKRLRGLYIIKSETNKAVMKVFGNLFTHYNYTTTDINTAAGKYVKTFQSTKSGLVIEVDQTCREASLPADSPFSEWKEARRFAGPLPFTFTYDEVNKKVLVIEGVRKNWKPTPIHINRFNLDYLNHLGLDGLVLASAFEINNVPYYWKKGKQESWN